MSIEFKLNGSETKLDPQPETTLLWVLREHLKLTGTKFGCGSGLCGACTVHLNGQPIRSCITPVSALAGKSVTTIEGLSKNQSHPLQKAWVEAQVPQCGYCQSGQIMQAAALLAENNDPSDEDIEISMRGNLCRCMTYNRIKTAIKKAGKSVDQVPEHVTNALTKDYSALMKALNKKKTGGLG